MSRHPSAVLFAGETALPSIPAVDHYCGAEKLMRKALELQQQTGPLFDITLDCEDGAPVGAERAHAQLCADLVNAADNRFGRVGVRIHDVTHPSWQEDLEILVGRAGRRLAFVTLPKPRSLADVETQVAALRGYERAFETGRELPVHVLVETHGALREAWSIAALAAVESLDFGLMDFVSAHHGAIPGRAMTSPGQFEHPLIARAKCEIAAAAIANGAIPSHNVTTELRDTSAIRADARRARLDFGFLRMWSIHPAQIEPILEAMRPDFSEIETATEILVTAQDNDWGPIRHAGKLHDRASYRYYWELLVRARDTGCALPGPVAARFFADAPTAGR